MSDSDVLKTYTLIAKYGLAPKKLLKKKNIDNKILDYLLKENLLYEIDGSYFPGYSPQFLHNIVDEILRDIERIEELIQKLTQEVNNEFNKTLETLRSELNQISESNINLMKDRLANIFLKYEELNKNITTFTNSFDTFTDSVYKVFDEFKQLVDTTFNSVNSKIDSTTSELKESTLSIIDSESEKIYELLNKASTDGIKIAENVLIKLSSDLKERVKRLSDIIKEVIEENRKIHESIREKLSDARTKLEINLPKRKDVLNEKINELLSTFVDEMEDTHTKTLNAFAQRVEDIKNEFAEAINFINNRLNSIISLFEDIKTETIDVLSKYLTEIISEKSDAINKALKDLYLNIGKILDKISSEIGSGITELKANIFTSISNLSSEIDKTLKATYNDYTALIRSVKESISDNLNSLSDELYNIIEKHETDFIEQIRKIEAISNDVKERITNATNSSIRDIDQKVNEFKNKVQVKITTEFSRIDEELSEKIKEHLTDFNELFSDYSQRMTDIITKEMEELLQDTVSMMEYNINSTIRKIDMLKTAIENGKIETGEIIKKLEDIKIDLDGINKSTTDRIAKSINVVGKDISSTFETMFTALTKILDDLLLNASKKASEEYKKIITDILEKLNHELLWFTETAGNMNKIVNRRIEFLINSIVDYLNRSYNVINTIKESSKKSIEDSIDKTTKFINEQFNTSVISFEKSINNSSKKIDAFVNDLRKSIDEAILNVNKSITEDVTGIKDSVEKTLSDFQKTFNDVITLFSENISTKVNEVFSSSIKEAIDNIEEIKKALTSYKSTSNEIFDNLTLELNEFIRSLETSISTLNSKLRESTLSALDESIKKIIEGANNILDDIFMSLEKSSKNTNESIAKMENIIQNHILALKEQEYLDTFKQEYEKISTSTKNTLQTILENLSGLLINEFLKKSEDLKNVATKRKDMSLQKISERKDLIDRQINLIRENLSDLKNLESEFRETISAHEKDVTKKLIESISQISESINHSLDDLRQDIISNLRNIKFKVDRDNVNEILKTDLVIFEKFINNVISSARVVGVIFTREAVFESIREILEKAHEIAVITLPSEFYSKELLDLIISASKEKIVEILTNSELISKKRDLLVRYGYTPLFFVYNDVGEGIIVFRDKDFKGIRIKGSVVNCLKQLIASIPNELPIFSNL